MMELLEEGLVRLFVGLVIAVPIGLLIYLGIQSDHEFQNHCTKLGGHVETFDSTGTGTGTDGKPVVTYNSTTLRLSKDGRILDHE